MKNQLGQKKTVIPPYVWIGAWIAIGAGVGVATDNIPLGIGFGLAIGAGIALTFYLLNKNKPKE